tara:strand:- start:10040 stop:10966 length:927 start_codon:yes stop_codon:yes gene_type:complete
MNNPVSQFGAELEAAYGCLGLTPIPNSQIHRFHVPGDKKDSKNGWYILFVDTISCGCFGSWKETGTSVWKSRLPINHLEEKTVTQRIEEARSKREIEQRQRHRAAAVTASSLWRGAQSADLRHPYLVAKNCKPHGLRQLSSDLLVPLCLEWNAKGQNLDETSKEIKPSVVSFQRIRPNGTKRFLLGGQVKGCYSPIGLLEIDQPIYICEGWATGATIHESTGAAVACAMNAGNLLAVGEQLRLAYPDNPLIVAGDDDRQTKGNPGRTAAVKASAMLGCALIFPPWNGTEPKELSDFNDLLRWREANNE